MSNTVSVTLTPGTNQSGQFEWTMSVDGKAQAPGTTPPLHAPKDTSPDFSFTIQNGPQQNYTFASFLVPAGTNEIHHVSAMGTTKFTFKDHNKNAGDIPYEILFNGGAAKLDPIIDNDGGGTGFYMSAPMVEYLGYAIAAAVLIFFVARRMMRKDTA
jgi:hypothetical protein